MLSDMISVALPASPVAARLQRRCSTQATLGTTSKPATNRHERTPKGSHVLRGAARRGSLTRPGASDSVLAHLAARSGPGS